MSPGPLCLLDIPQPPIKPGRYCLWDTAPALSSKYMIVTPAMQQALSRTSPILLGGQASKGQE